MLANLAPVMSSLINSPKETQNREQEGSDAEGKMIFKIFQIPQLIFFH